MIFITTLFFFAEGLCDCLTVGAGACCFSDWRLAQATHGACRRQGRGRLASPAYILGLGLAAVILILQLSKARAVFAYRSALDPRQNTQVFWFQIEAEIAEQRGMQIAASSPALCVLFATQASMFSAPLCGERSEPDLCSSALL